MARRSTTSSSNAVPATGNDRSDLVGRHHHVGDTMGVGPTHSVIASFRISASRSSSAPADTTSTSTPRSSAKASSRCTKSSSELDGSNSTRKSMSLSEVASPRATEPNTAIEQPRCRRTRSRISARFRSTIELRSGPAAMATAYELGQHRAGPSPHHRAISGDRHVRDEHHLPALRGQVVTGHVAFGHCRRAECRTRGASQSDAKANRVGPSGLSATRPNKGDRIGATGTGHLHGLSSRSWLQTSTSPRAGIIRPATAPRRSDVSPPSPPW